MCKLESDHNLLSHSFFLLVQPHSVKYVLKYCGNGCQSMEKQNKEIPQSVLGSQVCAGQRAWLQPGDCALMGCQCPILEGQNKGLGVRETGADSQYSYLKCSKSAFRHLKLINQEGI